MIYLINQEWSNTAGNHAGIKYLCDQLHYKYPQNCISITIPDILSNKVTAKNRIIRKLQHIIAKTELAKYYKKTGQYLNSIIKDGDTIFLMEYFTNNIPQQLIAEQIKAKSSDVKIFAMPHLTPMQLDVMYKKEDLLKGASFIDKFITLGSSLSIYLENIGIESSKIETSFHYVDNDYYTKKINSSPHIPTVIIMGNNARYVDLLERIVSQCTKTNFIICQGLRNYAPIFEKYKNVKLVGYVPEDELKNLMKMSDISLNVMKDTVGSNVIVTSMAMGLAMIVSDVGSIRDYCDESHTFFCDNSTEDTFINAIKKMEENFDLLYSMQNNSIKKAATFNIDNFYQYLQNIK